MAVFLPSALWQSFRPPLYIHIEFSLRSMLSGTKNYTYSTWNVFTYYKLCIRISKVSPTLSYVFVNNIYVFTLNIYI